MLNKRIKDIIGNLNTKEEKLSDILRVLVDYCKINQTKYCIIGSYAIRSKREINDLDVIMEESEWEKLKKAVNIDVGIIEIYNKQDRYFLDMTEAYKLIDEDTKDFSIEIFNIQVCGFCPMKANWIFFL
jgi:predicted nucleotidyltransferase